MPAELTKTAEAQLPIPMAVETFVSSLGVDLTDDQRSQLHGLLKRPSIDEDERSKRRKTEAPAGMASKRTLWVTLPQPSKGTAQGSWCPSPGTILMMIQTPYGFATLLLAQRKGGGQMFVKVQRNCHLQTRETFFSSTTKAQVKGSTPMSHSMFHKQPPQVDTILTSSQALNGAWMDLRLGCQDQLSSRSRVEHYQPAQQAIARRM